MSPLPRLMLMLTEVMETEKRGSPKCWIACHGLSRTKSKAIDMLRNILVAQHYSQLLKSTSTLKKDLRPYSGEVQ